MSSFNDLPFFPTGSYVENGKDGISPTITVNTITGGYRLSITDVNGPKIVNILHGKDGQQGIQGERGLTGEQGIKGERGDTGPTGPTGPQGEQGIQGAQGIQGVQGEKGETGSAGKDGSNGKSAFDFAQDGGFTGSEADFANLLANVVSKQNISIGLHTDGLLYLFIDGEPVGTGITLQVNTPEV